MARPLSIEDQAQTHKVDFVNPEDLIAPDALPLLTGDFELVDEAEVAPESKRRTPLFLVTAAPTGFSIATPTGSFPIVQKAPPETTRKIPLANDAGPHPINRRRARPTRDTQVLTDRVKRSWLDGARRTFATRARRFLDELRDAWPVARRTTVRLPLVLALVAGAFLLGALMLAAGSALRTAGARDLPPPATVIVAPPAPPMLFEPMIATPPDDDAATEEAPPAPVRKASSKPLKRSRR